MGTPRGFASAGAPALFALILVLAEPALPEPAASPDVDALSPVKAAELVRRAEDALRGDTAETRATMNITTPRWKRSVEFHSFDDRVGDRSFTRILAPRKEKGTGFLRLDQTLWTYLPRVERTTRIPPSMMMQSWMGSDFTNDDVARESSLVRDYTARLLGAKEVDGVRVLGAELIPDEEAAVVWGKIEIWVLADSYAPFLQIYYDEEDEGRFEVVRTLHFTDVRRVQGRFVPHHWRMVPADRPGHVTEIVLQEIVLDRKMDDAIFTKRNLKRAEAVR